MLCLFGILCDISAQDSSRLRIATFDIDATPPVGTELAYGKMIASNPFSLRAKGIVLIGSGKPIVLCAIDWLGIANESQDAFKEAMAKAAGTTPDRVEVHTVHQHDAPICDFTSEKILKEKNLKLDGFDGTFARKLIPELCSSIQSAIRAPIPVTEIGIGKADVMEVASNRVVRLEDGKVITRYSTEKRKKYRDAPEGVIDPEISLLSFWNGDKPLAVLSFYATHPQSYYRTGIANPDFPGIARCMRELEVPDVPHIHFNGAGGNVAAGKYNDGNHRNRLILAQRLAEGMKKAWEATKKISVTAKDIEWATEPLLLPPNPEVANIDTALAGMNRNAVTNNIIRLGWYRRRMAGKSINAACLKAGKDVAIVFMPGELFVEYQLAAKRLAPDKFVAMAAYGDYGPFYIGTKEAYDIGGYEIRSSPETSDVEEYILKALRKLLK